VARLRNAGRTGRKYPARHRDTFVPASSTKSNFPCRSEMTVEPRPVPGTIGEPTR